jgi:hypothetical protein
MIAAAITSVDANRSWRRSFASRAPARFISLISLILALRYTALRIGDVALLGRDRLSRENGRWRIFLRTEKSGKPVLGKASDRGSVHASEGAITWKRTVTVTFRLSPGFTGFPNRVPQTAFAGVA